MSEGLRAKVRRWSYLGFGIPALLWAIVLGHDAWTAASDADHLVDGDHVHKCPCPSDVVTVRGSEVSYDAAGLLLLVLLLLTWFAFWWPRRHRPTSLVLASVTTMALTAGVLGFVTYYPVAGGEAPVLVTVAGVLNLFLGAVDVEQFGSPAYPVGFEVARILAIVATGSSVIAAAAATWREQWDRVWVWFNGDMDVLVGLNDESISLVRALVAESRGWKRREWWHTMWLAPWPDIRRMFAPPPRVYVVVDSRDHPLAERARLDGARVVVGDPADPHLLRRLVLTNLPRRVALRRMYLLGLDQEQNLKLCRLVEEVLSTESVRRHRLDLVPRIVVRMDDAREARDWRAARIGQSRPSATETQWFTDAVSPAEVSAAQLVEHAIDAGVETLVLMGDSPLTLALLDELSWERWRRFDLLRAAASSDGVDLSDEWSRMRTGGISAPSRGLDELELERLPLPIQRVHLVGPSAKAVRDEWRDTRAPWGGGQQAESSGDAWTLLPLEVEFGGDLPAWTSYQMLVVTEQTAELVNAGRRAVSQALGKIRVFVPDAEVSGITAPTEGMAAVGRYGPTWVAGERPLEDSWSSIAAQEHNAYRQKHRPGVPEWDPPERVTGLPWSSDPASESGLPEFFRDDNLRQLRRIMQSFSERGYTWGRVTAKDRLERPHDEDLEAVAADEHARWLDLRRATGWSKSPTRRKRVRRDRPNDRDDWRRINPAVAEWSNLSEGVRQDNLDTVKRVLETLHATGLAVPRCRRFRRLGFVTAEQLDERRSWSTTNGSVLTVEAGDWWVTDESKERGVSAARFAELYEPNGDGTFRRLGEVKARRADPDERIETLEGPATAAEGDWLVDDETSVWFVPADHFAVAYELVR